MKIKNLNDSSLSTQLNDFHKDAPQSVTEDQIKRLRFTTEDSITEKLLEKTRTGSGESTIEKRLNDSKGEFGVKHRNSETSSGNINKLEEKRISNKKNEDEKYKPASSVKKSMRWWEAKTNDGLKIANNECKKCVISQVDARKLTVVKQKPITKFKISEDVDPYDYTENINLSIKGNKYIGTYDPEFFSNDEDFAKEVFLCKLTYYSPFFLDYIDISSVDSEDGTLTFTMPETEKMPIAAKSKNIIKKAQTQSPFNDLNFEKIDVGGTPTFIGSVNFNPVFAQNKDKNEIISQAIKFIKTQHPEVDLQADNFDSSKIYNGELSFLSSEEGVIIDEKEEFASSDFQIVTANTNVKKK